MKKPGNDDFVEFDREFKQASKQAGKKQYLIPYYIASHPGSDLDAMIDLALFLKRNDYKPDQVQDFIPSPFDIAACMYHTGLDPFTKKPVLHRQAPARPQAAAGAVAVLQAGELLRGPPGAGASRPAGPDRQRLRLPDSRAAAKGRARQAPQARQRIAPRTNRRRPHPRRAREELRRRLPSGEERRIEACEAQVEMNQS